MKPAIAVSVQERRASKAARREKQRQANGGRAQKMHLARLAAAQSTPVTDDPPKFNVGCSGWFYWGWRSRFYPQELPTKEWFSHYMKAFNTVELNAPFYSWPTVNAVRQWSRQAEKNDFVHTVKACELITHVKRFSRTNTLVKDFGHIADLLGNRMGCFVFQLPPSYNYTAARLKTIVGQMEPGRRNVVEFRHASWWNQKVYAAFKDANIIFCSCSAPKLPDELVKTTDEIYVRFHCTAKWYRDDYTREELEIWPDRIDKSGAKRVWRLF